ncbi:aldehyde dehydrogenase, dimeric NADP-preferring-like isoform X1 [Chironomus tepperi]|uniref:aldehyde dehydrogenase, dimeric NADP-preferring-like isoform X1 n=2 Tax=Chironomus tepperi TaxID=113505 RepID=UPI00391F821B
MLRNRKDGKYISDADDIKSNLSTDFLSAEKHRKDKPTSTDPTDMNAYSNVMDRLRSTFSSGKTKDIKFRKKQLEAMLKMFEENRDEICSVLNADLRRPKQEGVVFEINVMVNEILHLLAHMDEWSAPARPTKGLANLFDDVLVYKEPYGIVLVIGAWNYPIQLSLVPMAAAIAAGNCVVLKPSEVSSHSEKFLLEKIPKYLDNDCYQVISGGAEETTELLRNQFDYIFYTGSGRVGQIVYAAATKYMTPVTLELGGKSPCYVDDTVEIGRAVRRILWGKNSNAGQTCISPDYILCTKEIEKKFVEEFKAVIKEWYGEDVQKSPDYARIATDGHFKRLTTFLTNGTIAAGGRHDPDDRFIEPTLLIDLNPSDPALQEEIFGPIMPIVTVNDVHDAIDYINARDKPLSMYIFTNNAKDKNLMIASTSAGAVCVNDTVQHFASNIPFGGVGPSGMGQYHGKNSFDTFTHEKGCLEKSINFFVEKLGDARYPPYSDWKETYLTSLMKFRNYWKIPYFSQIVMFCLGIGATVLYQKYRNSH